MQVFTCGAVVSGALPLCKDLWRDVHCEKINLAISARHDAPGTRDFGVVLGTAYRSNPRPFNTAQR